MRDELSYSLSSLRTKHKTEHFQNNLSQCTSIGCYKPSGSTSNARIFLPFQSSLEILMPYLVAVAGVTLARWKVNLPVHKKVKGALSLAPR